MPDYPSKNHRTEGRFATTHWSMVLAASGSDVKQGKKALESLCQLYWFPIYAYLRRMGYDTHDCEDYTQAFLVNLLEKHNLRLAKPQRGKFRSFLLGALKHFLANEYDHNKAKKRGGDRFVFSLDAAKAEGSFNLAPSSELSPEKLFERSWAITILDRTLQRLQADAADAKKQKMFNLLKDCLALTKDVVPYSELARRLNMTEGAVKVAVHRLRRRYRELLRDEIAQTVETEEQIDDEIRFLFSSLGG
jgi:RNA polymerase sigma factor (sigma-70 family)